MMRRLHMALAAASILVTATRAQASPDFPDVIASTLSAPVPACTVCHATLSGGAGTVTKAFGQYLQQRGLAAGDTDSLKKALSAMTGEKHDSDKDGVTDEAALKQGKDPNGALSSNVEPIAYGCGGGNRIAARSPASGDALAYLAASGLVLALVRTQRRRRP